MKTVLKTFAALVFISIIISNIAAQCPYNYQNSKPGYSSRQQEFIGRAIVLKALQESYAYMYENEEPDSATQKNIDDLNTCWDSMFLAAANMIGELSTIKGNAINSRIVWNLAADYQLQDSLEETRLLVADLKEQIDQTRETKAEIDSLTFEEEKLEAENDSLKRHHEELHIIADSIISQVETMKISIFGEFLGRDTTAFDIYLGMMDTCKKLLLINALPESARITFVALNKDSVNNWHIFNRLTTQFWESINNDVEGVLVRFFPSINELEVDLECAGTLISLIQHTEDTTTSQILKLITAFWECYWAGEEEQHLQEFALDSDINIHDEPGPIDIEQLVEMRVSLIEKGDQLITSDSMLSDTQVLLLNFLDDIYWMNQEGRLSQKSADVAQELRLKPLNGTEIMEIRERFWATAKSDVRGMSESFMKRITGITIKDECSQLLKQIVLITENYYPESHQRRQPDIDDATQLNDLIHQFWLCQN